MPFEFLLIALWCGVCYVIGNVGGWQRLATAFQATGEEPITTTQWCQSGCFGGAFGTRYSNMLFLGLSPAGLRLSVLLPFRAGHPPLFIPWEAFEIVEKKKVFFSAHYVTTVVLPNGEHDVRFRFRSSKLAQAITQHQQQATPLQPDFRYPLGRYY